MEKNKKDYFSSGLVIFDGDSDLIGSFDVLFDPEANQFAIKFALFVNFLSFLSPLLKKIN